MSILILLEKTPTHPILETDNHILSKKIIGKQPFLSLTF